MFYLSRPLKYWGGFVDKLDLRIIELLNINSRTPFMEIARKLTV